VIRALLLIIALTFAARPATAAPDPTVAAVISVASTLVPLGVTAGLWATGRGPDEGVRFDIGLAAMAVGSILGPSAGQIYAEADSDAWISFVLRFATGAVMVAGSGLWLRGPSEGAQEAGKALTFVGAIPTAILAGWDIYSSAANSVEWARRQGYGPSTQAITPSIGVFSLCSGLPDSWSCARPR